MQDQKDFDLRMLHEGYHEYRLQCQRVNVERMDYQEWLEQTAVSAILKVGTLVEEIDMYQQAAQVTHQHYVDMRDRVEALDSLMSTVRVMLTHRQYQDALRYLKAFCVWN